MNGQTWTRGDEEAFQALAKRRAEIQARMREPVAIVAASLLKRLSFDPKSTSYPPVGTIPGMPFDKPGKCLSDVLAELMIEYADTLRDALEPFDSGERVAAG